MDRGWRWGGRGSRFWRIISRRMGRLRFRKRCAGIWGRIESWRRGRLRRATRLENGKWKIEKGNKKSGSGIGLQGSGARCRETRTLQFFLLRLLSRRESLETRRESAEASATLFPLLKRGAPAYLMRAAGRHGLATGPRMRFPGLLRASSRGRWTE